MQVRNGPPVRKHWPPPVGYPEVGIYHPRITGRVTGPLSVLSATEPAETEVRGTIGLPLLRSYVLANDARH